MAGNIDPSEVRAIAKASFDIAFRYNALTSDGIRSADLTPQDAWLRNNPDAWRVDRDLEHDVEGTSGQVVRFVVGEEGTGKTTTLNQIIEERRADPHTLIVRVDFTTAAGLMAADPDRCAAPLGEFLRRQVAVSVTQAGLDEAYDVAKLRHVIRDRAHGTLSEVRRQFGAIVDDLTDEMLLSSELITESVQSWENQTSVLNEGVLALEAVQRIRGRRVVLVIDNVDHLHDRKIDMVFAILSGALQIDTIAFIALRSEHESRALVFRQQRRVETMRLSDQGQRDVIFEILRTRVGGALAYLESLPSPDPLVLREGRELADELNDSVAILQADATTSQLLQQWQNGNIRQMLAFVGSIASRVRKQAQARSVRGLVYSELVNNAERELFDIFSPEHVPADKYTDAPFIFMRLRLLAYLKRDHKDAFPRSVIHEDFWTHFGIRASVVDQALTALETTNVSRGAFVRTTDSQVVLLPAGRCFMNYVVYSCDFLAWIYDQSQNLPPVSTFGPRSHVKLSKAVVVVERLLLPAFTMEHPYLQGKRNISPAMRVRLDSYRTLFNYGPGRWFIKSLSDELASYARDREIVSEPQALMQRRIGKMVARLDRIVAQSVQGPIVAS